MAAALAPRRAQRHAAIRTADKATQGEVVADILALGGLGDAVTARLYLLEGLYADQRLMVALEPAQAVVLTTDVACVERQFQNISDPLIGNLAFGVAWELGKALKKPPDFSLRLEASHGKALKRLADDRGQRLYRNQQLSMRFDHLVFVPDRRIVDPIAGLHPRFHLLRHLPPILFALQRALRRHDGFNELILWRVAQFHIETFHADTACSESVTQIEIGAGVTAGSFQIIKDDDEPFFRLRINEAQQSHHAGALQIIPATGNRVREHGGDFQAPRRSELTTAQLLALKPMPFGLRARRDPTIDHSLCV